MSKNKEKSLIQAALTCISRNNAVGMKKNIREALFSKIRRAIAAKEKQVAKNFLDEAISTSITEAKLSAAEIKKKIAEIKAIEATIDKLVKKDPKAFIAAHKKLYQLSDELVASGVDPKSGDISDVWAAHRRSDAN